MEIILLVHGLVLPIGRRTPSLAKNVVSGQSVDTIFGPIRRLSEMKLVMTLLVRDEADIVSSNIDFHLDQGVDFIIATDNLSVDGTTDILRAYERRGVLHYIHQTDDDYAQHRWVTNMARLACTQFAADWVINNDADEFWCPDRWRSEASAQRHPFVLPRGGRQACEFLAAADGGR